MCVDAANCGGHCQECREQRCEHGILAAAIPPCHFCELNTLRSKLDNAERGWAAASQSVLALESRLQGCEKAIAAIIRQVQPEWQPMVVANAITENPELRNVLEAAWPAGVERQES